MKQIIRYPVKLSVDVLMFIPLLTASLISRWVKRKVDVGLGPEPLINNVYHKRALELKGYRAETFCVSAYYITADFDFLFTDYIKSTFVKHFAGYFLFVRAVFRYRLLYIYFNGGPLFTTPLLWKIEPFLLKLANIKVVVMPYGSDVQIMSRCPNYAFKDAISKDYPQHRSRRGRIEVQIDFWSCHADHVISGCEWVDYMHHWDTLQLAHFSIDTEQIVPVACQRLSSALRILHAPNHRNIKGTEYFVQAVKELRDEDVDVELILLERVPNEQVKKEIAKADIIADQLIIGWYAMFAIEAMAMGKPVLCYIREDLKNLYLRKGLLKEGELPIIECNPGNVKDKIRSLIGRKKEFDEIGLKSRKFVQNHHSIAYIGGILDNINKQIGISPLQTSSE